MQPLKIVVWGPGGIGSILIRELAVKPEFELVGVYAYSPDKNGVDAGELAGIEPLGVAASTDFDEVAAIECDCVLHTARDYGDYRSVDEIVRLLEAGRNVITQQPYHLPEPLQFTTAPPDAAERIHAACVAGGSTFYATGINPEFVCGRLTGLLTGISSDIESIAIVSTWEASHIAGDHIRPFGYGEVPEKAETMDTGATMIQNFLSMDLHVAASMLGLTVDKFEHVRTLATAKADIGPLANGMSIKAGTVARKSDRCIGQVTAGDRTITIITEINMYLGPENAPDHLPARDPLVHGANDGYYLITVEGRPALRITLDWKGSFAEDRQLVIPEDPMSHAGWYATALPMLQCASRVSQAEPGWLELIRPVPHWAPDFRDCHS